MPVSSCLDLKMLDLQLERLTIGHSLTFRCLNRLCIQDKHQDSWVHFCQDMFQLGSRLSLVRKLRCPSLTLGLQELIRILYLLV